MNCDMPGKPAAMVLADAAMDVIHRLRQQDITTAADLARALNEPSPRRKATGGM
jgi:hypothetical protein